SPMDRRTFLEALAGGPLAAPLAAEAQHAARVPLVGYLSPVSAGTPGHAEKDATRTIPVVMLTGDDPVRRGDVATLARPGCNVTGVTFRTVDLFAKQMEMLKQAVPGLRRVAFLWASSMPTTKEDLREVRAAAHVLGLQLQIVEARGARDY